MKNILFLGLLFVSVTLFAQQPSTGRTQRGLGNIGRLYGKVLDATTKEPIEFASVVVYKTINKKDSLIGGGLTKSNGDFNIDELPLGAVKLKVSFIGYRSFTKNDVIAPPDNLEIDLGDLALATDEKVLKQVEVTAEKVQMQLGLDKKIFNVEKNITATGGTAEDVLKNIPSVTVDADGNAQLRNNSTTVYVDGRPTMMTLNQIPSDQIESVEVISNPSAKFEAAASGGILNIILKKNKKTGYNGFLAFGIATGNRYNGTANLNVRQGRWNVTTFYNFSWSNNPTNSYAFRKASDQSVFFDQKTNTKFNNSNQVGRLSVEYSVNNRNTLIVSGNIVRGAFNVNSNQNYIYPTETRDSALYSGARTVRPQNVFLRYQTQINWKKTYGKKGKELVADANFEWGNTSNVAKWTTTGLDKNGQTLPNFPELVQINGGNIGQQLTLQLDYVNPLNDSSKIEMGLRSFTNIRDQQYFFNQLNYTTQKYELQSNVSQNAYITDYINAAYATYTNRWHGISYQLGVRYEQSHLTGTSRLDNSPSFGFNYPKSVADLKNAFFPSAYFSKKLTKNSEIQFNASRKINRPDFMKLMPIIMTNDRQNIRIGNPKLQPEFINIAELNYNKLVGNNNWLASLYFRQESNVITTFASPFPNDPTVILTTFINGKNSYRYGLDNTVRFAVGKNMDVTSGLNVYNTELEANGIKATGWTLDGKLTLNYKFPSNFSAQLQGNYDGRRVLVQGERRPTGNVDFAVKKTFFGGAANIVLSVSDIFNTRKEILAYQFTNFYQETMRRRDIRFYKISFQIPFGKADASVFKKAKERRSSGQSDSDFGG